MYTKCDLEFDFKGDKKRLVDDLKKAVTSSGGTFNGDYNEGECYGTNPVAYKLNYSFAVVDKLSIKVIRKPIYVSCTTIKSSIEKYLENYNIHTLINLINSITMEDFKNELNGLDGKLYLDDKDLPKPNSSTDWSTTGASDTTEQFWESDYFIDEQADTSANGRTIYERVIAKWKDPTSLPHTRKKCVKWCQIGPWKECCGWKLQYRYIYNTATIRVTTAVPKDIKKALEDCIKTAAVAAAIAAILSGGSAAIAAAEAAIKACLYKKFGSDLLSVAIKVKPRRGGWE